MNFLLLHVYDIRLWAAPGFNAKTWSDHPLALEIEYARALSGTQIAERSLEEMRRQGPLNEARTGDWLAAMKQAFPDVRAGDRITGVQRPGTSSRFYLNGVLRREIRDAEFTRLFFGIWLSARTSEPKLRTQLTGSSS